MGKVTHFVKPILCVCGVMGVDVIRVWRWVCNWHYVILPGKERTRQISSSSGMHQRHVSLMATRWQHTYTAFKALSPTLYLAIKRFGNTLALWKTLHLKV